MPFVRSDTNRYLAGIAGGEGERLGVDPFFLRIGLVGATLLLARNDGGGFVLPLLAYLVGWLVLPSEAEPSLLRRLGQRSAQQVIAGALALFVLAVVVIGRPSLVWVGILLAVSVMLLGNRAPVSTTRTRSEVESPSPPSGAHPGETRADGATAGDELPGVSTDSAQQERAVSWGRSMRGAIGPRPMDRPQRPERVRRPRRSPALWPLTLSLLFAYGFACLLLDNLLDPGIDPGIAVNGAVLIVGGVVLLSGWRGRALATTLLLVPIVPAWVAFSVADTPRFADVGASGSLGRYDDGAIIEQTQGYGGLSLTIAPDELPESGQLTARVGVTAGQADVYVPKEADLHIVGHVGLGQISVYSEYLGGYYSYTGYADETLADYGLDRSYGAVGRECFDLVTDETGLRNAADWSGVAIPTKASGKAIADIIERAGYPRPTAEVTTGYDFYLDDVDGTTYDNFGNEVIVDESTGSYQQTTWAYQANENNGLCLPEAPPQDPVLITIDATIGLGNLKVHRV